MRDVHSYARPEEKCLRHIDLLLRADFDRQLLEGRAVLRAEGPGDTLVLDTRGLEIRSVNRPFRLGSADSILGTPLQIETGPGEVRITIDYATGPDASALQWLDDGPCLFTQSQAIHARSWAPVQDTPGVRVTWSAQVEAPSGLRVLTSGGHLPVPSYLMALAIGRFDFAPLSPRCGVWAPPALLATAAREFEDIERMMDAAEDLYGPYRWGRYDILVMPPSFPFGGMENPCLTFATPTILAGDKSLVSLVAHELAHSWSGNLVTNATWHDFWLNEGFTTYAEHRIQEKVYGERRARMEAVVELSELREELTLLPEPDHLLVPALEGRDPDDGCTLVPYVRGAALLRCLEQFHGRDRFDRFLRAYIDRFAFRSITTAQFVEYYEKELGGYDLGPWLHQPELPPDLPEPQFQFEAEPKESWATQEWLHWLRSLPSGADLAAIDARWRLTSTGNSEILCAWLKIAVERGHSAAFGRVEEFLCSVGRRKFLKPLYRALGERGRPIFERAKAGYHPVARAEIEKLFGS